MTWCKLEREVVISTRGKHSWWYIGCQISAFRMHLNCSLPLQQLCYVAFLAIKAKKCIIQTEYCNKETDGIHHTVHHSVHSHSTLPSLTHTYATLTICETIQNSELKRSTQISSTITLQKTSEKKANFNVISLYKSEQNPL